MGKGGGNSSASLRAQQDALRAQQESLRIQQYQENERKKKESDSKAGAISLRQAGNVAYQNMAQQNTTLTPGAGQGASPLYSLLTTNYGTPSVLGSLMGGSNQNNTLG